MKSYVSGLRILADGLDLGEFVSPTAKESAVRASYLKSIVAARDLPVGRKLSADDLTLLRPGTGIPPKDMEAVVGLEVRRQLEKGAVLSWDDLEA